VLEHCREGEPTVGSPFFGAFLSDSIPKATKDVNVHLIIHSSNSRKLYQRITVNSTSEVRESFETTAYIYIYIFVCVCVDTCTLCLIKHPSTSV